MTSVPRETPYTVRRGSVETDKWLLTHMEWHPSNWFGDFGQPETGIRKRQPNGEFAEFELIQHGWWNFPGASKLILNCLEKGWDTYRISTLMEWLKDRRSCNTHAITTIPELKI